jgi:hypothetical protein
MIAAIGKAENPNTNAIAISQGLRFKGIYPFFGLG